MKQKIRMQLRKRLFLRWALFTVLTIIACVFAYRLGTIAWIYESDKSKLSVLIFSIFWIMTAYCGVLVWRVDRLRETDALVSFSAQELDVRAEHGLFSAMICEKLGLIGTVIGMVMTVTGDFSALANSDMHSVLKLFTWFLSRMLTAFLTTLVGSICGTLLETQYHALTNYLKRVHR